MLEAIAGFRNVLSGAVAMEKSTPVDLAEDVREVLECRLARFAAGGSEK
jgi:hypothetical protein